MLHICLHPCRLFHTVWPSMIILLPSSLQLANTTAYFPLCSVSSKRPYFIWLLYSPLAGTLINRCFPANVSAFIISLPNCVPAHKPISIASELQQYLKIPSSDVAPIPSSVQSHPVRVESHSSGCNIIRYRHTMREKRGTKELVFHYTLYYIYTCIYTI